MSTGTYPFVRRAPMHLTFGFGVALLTLFALVPAVMVVFFSFTSIRGIPGLPSEWVGLQNYLDFFSAARLDENLNAGRNTFVFAIVTAVLQITIGLGFAMLLNRRLRGVSFYRSVVFMPTVLGVTVTGLVFSLVFNSAGGPAATVLSWFGAESAFFGDPKLALALVILVQVWSQVGITTVIFLAGLQAIPSELYEVAAIDGASSWQRFRWVTFPMLAPSMTANVLLAIVNGLQSYQLAYVLTGPTNKSTQVLSLLIYVQSFGSNGAPPQSQGYAASVSMVQFVLVGIIAFAALAYLRRREARL